MELIGPESCDKVRTWYTAAFGLDLVSLTVKKYISKLDVMIDDRGQALKRVDITIVVFARRSV